MLFNGGLTLFKLILIFVIFVKVKCIMKIKFSKYQGTGNDFVILDNRQGEFPKGDTKLIKQLCDRRFGIGADGLLLLEDDPTTDFRMIYYNSDGNESSMCGNGGRCIVAFAKSLRVFEGHDTRFMAVDGLHHATILSDNVVSLQMTDVDAINVEEDYVFMNTGSPHHVMMIEELETFDVKNEGAQIRYSDLYGAAGSNVNFVKQLGENQFALRTYERGVEDETLSCGTGATAAAIAMFVTGRASSKAVRLAVEGGELEVSFETYNNVFSNVLLKGPATLVYEGEIAW
jgi:diaminopimelate epimerase